MPEQNDTEIVLVMNKPGNIGVLQDALASLGYKAVGVTSERELEALFSRGSLPALALIDVSGFGASVWQICAALHNSAVPFIVLSTPQELEFGSRSLQYGASSVLQKPVAKSALLELVRSLTA